MPVKNRFAELHDDITEWRRDIHANPEILYETHRTSALVADKLRAFGCDEVVTGIGRTGVVGVIKGKATGSGKVIGLRADMDALPIHEETGLDFASEQAADLIVMATHGRTGLQRFLIGSVTEKVVRSASCPVFTVKSFGKSLVTRRAGEDAA